MGSAWRGLLYNCLAPLLLYCLLLIALVLESIPRRGKIFCAEFQARALFDKFRVWENKTSFVIKTEVVISLRELYRTV